MVKLIVDEALGKELNSVQGPVALCDPSGRVLGHFVPLSTLREHQQAIDECPHTEAELERLERQTGGRTLAEIWKSLGRAVNRVEHQLAFWSLRLSLPCTA